MAAHLAPRVLLLVDEFKVAQTSFNTFKRPCYSIRRIKTSILYHVTAMFKYHRKHQSLLNKMQLFS